MNDSDERCETCRKVHMSPEVVGANGVKFWPGHEYIIRTKTSQQKYPREWRMGYIGFGYGMEWSARGPDRTHGGQYGGTQHLDLQDIIYAEEVVRDDEKRHVGQPVKGEPAVNDAHDNAADDAAMWQRVQTNLAIEAFRKMELKRMQLEMAEYELTKLTNGKLDLDRYVEETEQIRRQMELKRADMARLGKLPRETHAPMPSAPVVRPTRAEQARRTPREAPLG